MGKVSRGRPKKGQGSEIPKAEIRLQVKITAADKHILDGLIGTDGVSSLIRGLINQEKRLRKFRDKNGVLWVKSQATGEVEAVSSINDW